MTGEDFARRARGLAWLLTDVDGVLTDGRLLYGPAGEELKAFDVKDGLGIKLARRAGLKVGLLSARKSAALERRAADLELDAVLLGCDDKGAAFDRFLAERAATAESVAYAGDDLPDLPVLLRCGLSFAPADAVEEVRGRVARVLHRPGGGGALREVVELVLCARGAWEGILASHGAA